VTYDEAEAKWPNFTIEEIRSMDSFWILDNIAATRPGLEFSAEQRKAAKERSRQLANPPRGKP
jgi:hypothetical protein